MRKPDWQFHFSEFVAARAQMPFAWGANDCSLFACDAMLAMTGVDHAAAYRGYRTERAARRIIRQGGGLRAIAAKAMGEAISPLYANLGDLVLVDNAGRELLGICNGTSVIAAGELGMAVLSMSAVTAAWRV